MPLLVLILLSGREMFESTEVILFKRVKTVIFVSGCVIFVLFVLIVLFEDVAFPFSD